MKKAKAAAMLAIRQVWMALRNEILKECKSGWVVNSIQDGLTGCLFSVLSRADWKNHAYPGFGYRGRLAGGDILRPGGCGMIFSPVQRAYPAWLKPEKS